MCSFSVPCFPSQHHWHGWSEGLQERVSHWLAGRSLSFDLVFLCSVILGECGAINSYTLSCVVAPLAATPVCVQHGVCAGRFVCCTHSRQEEGSTRAAHRIERVCGSPLIQTDCVNPRNVWYHNVSFILKGQKGLPHSQHTGPFILICCLLALHRGTSPSKPVTWLRTFPY
jgi:hypothetical protein